MDRCHLKGETGDRLQAVLCAAGYNTRVAAAGHRAQGSDGLLRLLPTAAVAAMVIWFADQRDLKAFMRPSDSVAVS